MKESCAPIRDLLPLYAEGKAAPETRAFIERHLSECPECQHRFSELRSVDPRARRKRRWLRAAIAALCVFVAVFPYVVRMTSVQWLPWEDGLIQVKGSQSMSPDGFYYEGDDIPESMDVLRLQMDGRIGGISERTVIENDGRATTTLQAWRGASAREPYMRWLCPTPDRLIYSDGMRQILLWECAPGEYGETPMRPIVPYAVLLAAAFALILGVLWLVFRTRRTATLLRQLFFAPAAYLAANILLKGIDTASLRHTFILSVALYALLSLTGQALRQRRKSI